MTHDTIQPSHDVILAMTKSGDRRRVTVCMIDRLRDGEIEDGRVPDDIPAYNGGCHPEWRGGCPADGSDTPQLPFTTDPPKPYLTITDDAVEFRFPDDHEEALRLYQHSGIVNEILSLLSNRYELESSYALTGFLVKHAGETVEVRKELLDLDSVDEVDLDG